MREGDFYPYMKELSYDGESNQAAAVNVKDNRHQLLCTLTYSF